MRGFSLTTKPGRSRLHRMKLTILSLFLLTSLVSAQNPAIEFQDASPKRAPASLSVKYYPGVGPYTSIRNISEKAILAYFATTEATDSRGQSVPCHFRADLVFKNGVLPPQKEGYACPMDISSPPGNPSAKIVKAVGAVLWVQFEDGSTWGDAESGRHILSMRAPKLAYLQKLVAEYDENGEASFNAILNDQRLDPNIWAVAGCLMEDAKHEKIPAIDLARRRLAEAERWGSLLGPF
jgi:hypothetical protein